MSESGLPWAAREYFAPWELRAWHIATRAVERCTLVTLDPDERPTEVRCHELARAVYDKLINSQRLTEADLASCVVLPSVVDGKWGAIDHSWITWATRRGQTILDPYVPGAMPMVQLLDASTITKRGEVYVASHAWRTDIRQYEIKRLLREMTT